MRAGLVACLAAGCFYPEKHLDVVQDGRTPDGTRDHDGAVDGASPDVARLPDASIDADAIGPVLDAGSGGCAFLPFYDLAFTTTGSDPNEDADTSTQPGFTEALQWVGLIQPSPEQVLVLDAFSGGGSASPNWPTGDVEPASNLELAGNLDVQLFLGANIDGSGVANTVYLAVSGTLSITQTTPSFAGSTGAVTFQHYDFVGSAGTPDPDNCTSSIASLSFSAPVE